MSPHRGAAAGVTGRSVSGLAAVALVLALLLGCASSPPELPALQPRHDVTHWADAFDAVAEPLREQSRRESTSGDSWDQYGLAYAVDAFTSMYEATGERVYLEDALVRLEDVVARARPSTSLPDPRHRDDFLGWVSQRADVRDQQVALFESYLWRYGARLLRVMGDDPAVRDEPDLRARHAALLAFAERHVFDKWYARGPEQYLLRSRTHMASHWAYISQELATQTDDPARVQRYGQVADAVDKGLRRQLELGSTSDGPYVWSDVWGRDRPAQDVAHGNADVAYVVAAHERGRGWDDADLTRFAATLTELVSRSDGSSGAFVDGSGEGTGWLSDGFVTLGRHHPGVQARLEDHQPQNGQYLATMALNARRLGDEAG